MKEHTGPHADQLPQHGPPVEVSLHLVFLWCQLPDAEAVWTNLRDGHMEQVQQLIPHKKSGPKHSIPLLDYDTKSWSRGKIGSIKKEKSGIRLPG